jgi:phospholipase C
MKSIFKFWLASTVALSTVVCPALAGDNIAQWRGEFSNDGHALNLNTLVHLQPNPTHDVAPYVRGANGEYDYGPQTQKRMIDALQKKVKFVFVIFNENRSFDNEFGTFPGVNGLYSDGIKPRSAANTIGFTQTYTDQATGLSVSVQPFGIGPQQNATVVDSVDHSHTGLAKKIDVVNGVAKMDGFASDQYTSYANNTAAGQAKGKQFANLVMSHVDCETIPFFWYYASRFTIFDNIFATEDTPSTPNAIALLAGQAGETQWVKHGPAGIAYNSVAPVCGKTYANGTTQGVPVVNDPQPFYGSEFDSTATNREPAGCNEGYGPTNISNNITVASVPLTLLGKNAAKVTAADLNPAFDLADIQQDIPYLTWYANKQVGWRWYQEGFDLEPTDTTSTASHASYVSHHDGAGYFGYIANNPEMNANHKGLGDFFNDVANGKLPNGGVIYIRGGYTNLQGLKPPIQNPNYPQALTASDIAAIVAAKSGDDNHPS